MLETEIQEIKQETEKEKEIKIEIPKSSAPAKPRTQFFLSFWSADHMLRAIGNRELGKQIPVFKSDKKGGAVPTEKTLFDVSKKIATKGLKWHQEIKVLQDTISKITDAIIDKKTIIKEERKSLKQQQKLLRKSKQALKKKLAKDVTKYGESFFVRDIPKDISDEVVKQYEHKTLSSK